MQVGAIGSYSYVQPYVYNSNTLSAGSMRKISGIDQDLLSSSTDFSSLTKTKENTNPLKIGETPNFADILTMQMQMGKNHAAKIMKAEDGMSQTDLT